MCKFVTKGLAYFWIPDNDCWFEVLEMIFQIMSFIKQKYDFPPSLFYQQ